MDGKLIFLGWSEGGNSEFVFWVELIFFLSILIERCILKIYSKMTAIKTPLNVFHWGYNKPSEVQIYVNAYFHALYLSLSLSWSLKSDLIFNSRCNHPLLKLSVLAQNNGLFLLSLKKRAKSTFLLGEGQSMGGCFSHVMKPFLQALLWFYSLNYEGMHWDLNPGLKNEKLVC